MTTTQQQQLIRALQQVQAANRQAQLRKEKADRLIAKAIASS
jgi:hypothetical protein